MANIILDEKRSVKVGEVCAVSLKDIESVNLVLQNPKIQDDIAYFYGIGSISNDDEITFVKYIGNGLFMDLVSDQLLLSELVMADDFGTDELLAMDEESIDEFEKIADFYEPLFAPQNKEDFVNSFSTFIKNPLVIRVERSPFMSLNSENTRKFASQSLEQLKSKIMSAKGMAQQNLKQQYEQYEAQIVEYFTENESVSKTV